MGTSTTPQSVSPASSPDRSPLRQRLRRADSYEEEEESEREPEEELEGEPEEESEPEEDPEEEPEEEPLSIEHAPVDTSPAEHTPEYTYGQREGKQIVEEIQGTFEVGQTSRVAQTQGDDPEAPLGLGMRAAMLRIREEQEDLRRRLEEGIDGEAWKDIECVPRADFPDSPISDIPDDISTPNPPDPDVNARDSIWTLLYQHASALDIHTEQLEGLQPSRCERYDQDIDTLFRRADAERREVFDLGVRIDQLIDTMDRAACVLFEDAIADRHERTGLRARFEELARAHIRELWELDSRFHGMGRGQARLHNRLSDMGRDLEISRDTVQAQGQRIASLESMLRAQLMINQEYRGRFEQLEATQKELVAGMERLRLERDRD